jgi:hypothetical protein
MRPQVSVIYSFARSGGTLLNRCIGSIPGNIVLSEVNPCGDVMAIEAQAHQWFGLIDEAEAAELAEKTYIDKITFLAHRAKEKSLNLIIRDWSAVNYIDHASNDFHLSSLELEQEFYLSHADLDVKSVTFSRKSEDVYISIKNNFEHLKEITVQDFGKLYLAYAQKVSKYSVFHYEDFCNNPAEILGEICRVLNVAFDGSFLENFSNYDYCTGDSQFSDSSRGYRLGSIQALPPQGSRLAREEAQANEDLILADKWLKYAEMFSADESLTSSLSSGETQLNIIGSRDREIANLSHAFNDLQIEYSETVSRLHAEHAATASRLHAEHVETVRQFNGQIQQINDELQNARGQVEKYFQELEKTKIQLSIYEGVSSKCDFLENENKSFKYINNQLQDQIDMLSSSKGAIRQLVKLILKRIKVYDLIYDNHRLFVPVFNLFFRDNWLPATIYGDPSKQLSADHVHLQPTKIEKPAAVNAGSRRAANSKKLTSQGATPDLPFNKLDLASVDVETAVGLSYFTADDIDFSCLHETGMLLASLERVLCINPGKKIVHLLLMMSRFGAEITCVHSSTRSMNEALTLISSGFNVIPENLENWVIQNGLNIDFDAVVFDQVGHDEVAFFKGRLKKQASLLMTNDCEIFEDNVSPLDNLVLELKDLKLYKEPGPEWIDIAKDLYIQQGSASWPWNFRLNQIPECMPSGKSWPKISVVTPTFNAGDYLEQTIRSVLFQGYPNLEYIVIDGGSTDQTQAILQRYDKELTKWVSEPDKGQSNAINKGFQLATGEILAWLNGDDFYVPGSLFKVALAFEKYQSDLIVGGCQLIQGFDSQPFKLHRCKLPLAKPSKLSLQDLLKLDECWQEGHFFYQPEVFWTKDIWERSGGYVDENLYFSMDYDLWVRMAAAGATIAHIADPLTIFRMHPAQKTFGDGLPFLEELRKVNLQYRRQYL